MKICKYIRLTTFMIGIVAVVYIVILQITAGTDYESFIYLYTQSGKAAMVLLISYVAYEVASWVAKRHSGTFTKK